MTVALLSSSGIMLMDVDRTHPPETVWIPVYVPVSTERQTSPKRIKVAQSTREFVRYDAYTYIERES
jgi:hypothetical protein